MSRALALAPDAAGQDASAGKDSAARKAMVPLPWMDILATGVQELDDWHRRLLDECNDLVQARNAGAPLALIVARANRMIANVTDHFAVEEDLMQRTGFRRLDQHIAEHVRVRHELPLLVAALQASGADDAGVDRSLDRLQFALLNLLLRHDLDYRSHLLDAQGR
jgi:hemerythrin-like metal-binding protein